MRCVRPGWLTIASLGLASSLIAMGALAPSSRADAITEANASVDAFLEACNANDLEAANAQFRDGELVVETGETYRGEAVGDLLARFFEEYPDVTLQIIDRQTVILSGSIVLVTGTKIARASEGADEARNPVRILVVRKDEASGDDPAWRIASIHEQPPIEFDPESAPIRPRDRLEPLAWMVGDWISEEADSLVTISCNFSEDQAYLIRKFQVIVNGQMILDSTQRIGWDPLRQEFRSWLFDSDGGFGEGRWNFDSETGRWIVKSTGVLPDGLTGSATFGYLPIDADRFQWSGRDRIVGGFVEADFDVTVVRRPPAQGP